MIWIIAKLIGFRAWLTAAARWITGSPVRIMGAVIIALLLALAWWQAGIAARDREIAALQTERDGWRKAEEVTRKSNDTLTAALHEQNAAVTALKIEADKRVLAGQAALGAAKDRSAAREGLAARIDAQRAPAGTGDNCQTSAAVMAGKDQL